MTTALAVALGRSATRGQVPGLPDARAVGGPPPREEPLVGALAQEDASEFERGQVAGIQRARLLAAAGQVACEQGVRNVTVAQIVERAGVSRRTFYEAFRDVEDCLLGALGEALQRAHERLLDGWASEGRWRERARRSLAELLGLFDEDRVLAQLLVVESLGVDHRVLEERLRVLDAVIDAIDDAAGTEAGLASGEARLSAESAIGGILGVLHARVSRSTGGSLIDLVGPFMSMLVLPYHGAAAARRELARPAPPQRNRIDSEAPLRSDPFKDAGMRLTYRTTCVLNAIAEHGGCSNRQIGKLAGISDQGQVSKLLARLERIGVIVNDCEGHGKGERNSWTLSSAGLQLIKNLRRHTEHDEVQA